jgi:hypothetical protein
VTHRPALLLAILVYLALDLSLPAMPGAFVFEPADSVESVRTHRGRTDAEPAALPDVAREAHALSRPRVDVADVVRPSRPVDRPRHPVVGWRCPLPGGPPPRSDDPH